MSEHETVQSTARAIREGSWSAAEAARLYLDRVDAHENALQCFREIDADRVLEKAKRIDERIAAGEDVGPLAGVPIAVKDNIATGTGRTTAGSRILEHFQSPYTATAVRRLTDAGAIVLGKTNCDAFGMGSSTEHCAWGATRNPWGTEFVPGGSSGGSAASVAAGLCPAALASDTGGSIRQPAALSGVVGAKPSYGRVSRYGLIAFGSSLDQIGPITSNVTDAALLMSIIAGVDPHDATSADEPVPEYASGIDEPIENLRIGVPAQYLSDDNHHAVNEAIARVVETFRDLGATIVEVDLPLTEYGIATYYILAPAEASSNLARYDGIRYGRRAALEEGEDLFDLYAKSRAEGFGEEVQRRIMLGTYVLSAGYYEAYYKRALQVRRLIKREFDAAFQRCDAIIGPTSPIPAFRFGAKSDPLTMYLCDVYTTNTSIAGICGISIPCGFAEVDQATLPIGLQIQCPAFDEQTMFRIARLFERNTSFHRQHPPAFASA